MNNITQLKARKRKIEEKLAAQKGELQAIHKVINEFNDELRKIKAEIQATENRNKELVITDHAIVRYLERVRGFDVEKCKEQMASKQVVEAIQKSGLKKYPIGKNLHLIIENGKIVTIK